jgi:CMP-N,N'-diacetyllegionaminic acid synthase
VEAELSVIAIICARGGSKGLLRKNLRDVAGEPLIVRPIRHAFESGVIDVVLVTTDDEEIADVALKAGAEVPFLRPTNLSGDLATTEETLKHALLTYEALKNRKFDICVFLTATDIFRDVDWIKEAVHRLKSDSDVDSAFVGYQTHKNFWELDSDGNWVRLRDWMAIYSSRQIRRSVIREDTGLSCATRAKFWRIGRRLGDKVSVIVTDDDFTSIDIHNQEDLDLANCAIKIRGNRG